MGGWGGGGDGNDSEYFHTMFQWMSHMIYVLGVCVPSSHCLLFPDGAEGLALSLFNLWVSFHSSHVGHRDKSHHRAELIMRGSQVRSSGEVVSKDRECLILLPPTDLFQRIQE